MIKKLIIAFIVCIATILRFGTGQVLTEEEIKQILVKECTQPNEDKKAPRKDKEKFDRRRRPGDMYAKGEEYES